MQLPVELTDHPPVGGRLEWTRLFRSRWQVGIKTHLLRLGGPPAPCEGGGSSPSKPQGLGVRALNPALRKPHWQMEAEATLAGGQQETAASPLASFLQGVVPGPLGNPATLQILPGSGVDAEM